MQVKSQQETFQKDGKYAKRLNIEYQVCVFNHSRESKVLLAAFHLTKLV